MKRAAPILALITGAIVLVVFLILGLTRGARADRCAEELVEHSKDRAFLEAVVKSPTLPGELAAAHQVELGFVRPFEADTARVGLFVKATATSTKNDLVVLLLERGDNDACVFLRDYETGAFSH
jgi:hypothetical protein